MWNTCLRWTLSLCLILSSAILRAQAQLPSSSPTTPVAAANPKTPLEFFARARQLSDLIAAGIPFHIKASYVASGDAQYFFTGKGTFEEWWQSKTVWRKEATLGTYRWVQIRNGARTELYTTADYVPLRLRQVVNAVPMSFPSTKTAESSWKMQRQRLSGVDLVILSSQHVLGGTGNPQLVIQNYFTPEGVLRIHQVGASAIFYNGFQPLQGLLIPRQIEIASDNQKMLAITIDLLEPLNPSPAAVSNLTSAPQGLQLVIRKQTSSSAQAPLLLYSPPPNYPSAAKRQRMQGTVDIHATIDENGKVREPYVLTSAGLLLDSAALEAVRQWRYKPTMIDGKPIAVETTISVIFSLRQ